MHLIAWQHLFGKIMQSRNNVKSGWSVITTKASSKEVVHLRRSYSK